MSSVLKPNEQDDGLEAAVEQAIAVRGGGMRAAIRADRRQQLLGIRDLGVEEGRIARLHAGALSELHGIDVMVCRGAKKHQVTKLRAALARFRLHDDLSLEPTAVRKVS